MIGGIDVRIPTRPGVPSAEVSVRAIGQFWPDSVFENGLTGERYDSSRQIPFGEVEELFVYRDSIAADLWDAEGAVPAAFNSMIHLVVDPDMLTVVVDERDAGMEAILATIRSALAHEILSVSALPEAG